MAKKNEAKGNAAQVAADQSNSVDFPLTKMNYILLVIGFAIIIIGFLLMIGGKSESPDVFNREEIFSFRRITLAPVTVLFGFIFEIFAIMYKPKEKVSA